MFYCCDVTRRGGSGVLVEGISNVEKELVLGSLRLCFHHTECTDGTSQTVCPLNEVEQRTACRERGHLSEDQTWSWPKKDLHSVPSSSRSDWLPFVDSTSVCQTTSIIPSRLLAWAACDRLPLLFCARRFVLQQGTGFQGAPMRHLLPTARLVSRTRSDTALISSANTTTSPI
jgi:hypothetical protein